MPFNPQNPLVVQSDRTVLLEVQSDLYESARDALARFAELEKSPEYLHTYRLTPLSLWNAAAAGLTAPDILGALEQYSKYDLPSNIRAEIAEQVGRYGRVRLLRRGEALALESGDEALIAELARHKAVAPLIRAQPDARTLLTDRADRGRLKQALVGVGYPAQDEAGYTDGRHLPLRLRAPALSGEPFALRHYQQAAVQVFHAGGAASGGSGVIVLPCGAGKTLVGMGVMAALQTATLILTPSTVAARQWIAELLDKTTLTLEEIGEYSGLEKEIRPVTIATYQIVSYRSRRSQAFPHFSLFDREDWGLIIYDEVHLLPAPVFRITADLQARRRLGLTATLVREDGHEKDVFSLIGPKKYDVPWKVLEKQGWIATAECHEIRLNLPADQRLEYALVDDREKYRFAAENPVKLAVLEQVLAKHQRDSVLVIGQYLDQLDQIAARLGAPLITGQTPVAERERLFAAFRAGEVACLVVSKVGNFAVDLPDANVLIQVSGTFGSRQEEAQRLGRILRPKRNGLLAHFYTLVTRETRDQEFAANRQLFLTEQGYHFDILYEHEVAGWKPATLAAEAYVVRRPPPALPAAAPEPSG
ncbi:MAG: DEAD/DEAH box helicase [Anaerolineales bacterium]|nr:DEAD/DEAH box helicase [Anaerolineales bacterium]